MPTLRAGKTVIFVHRKITGQDAYGNDVYDYERTEVPGCAVSPGRSTETEMGTLQIESDVTVHVPSDTVVDLPLDQMIIDGVMYNVVGTPNAWTSPFTGTVSMLEVQGRYVSTGGAAT